MKDPGALLDIGGLTAISIGIGWWLGAAAGIVAGGLSLVLIRMALDS